ncbi:Protein FAR1-RELATED SEQUENCE 11 [Bienertia sinuspersici]
MKKSPKKIITDQDPWMKQAIAQELETIEDFENQWPLVVGKYNLLDNKHVKGLYQIKEFWAPAYLRSYNFGGMRTTGRSEYINGFIKRFVTPNSTLKDLAKQIDVAIREIIQRQEHDNMLAVTKMNVLKVSSPLETKASQVLTPFAFEKLKEECCRASQYSIIRHDGYDFLVRYFANENSKCHKVFWDGNFATCSCKKFEFLGIICRHILRTFVQMDCHEVPSIYLPTRWCVDRNITPTEVPSEQPIQCNELINELTKQIRHCSKCKKVGHYANNCWLDKEHASVSNGAPKNKCKLATTSSEELNPIFLVKY